eukprot:1630723-Lingulodinium_polyedra.AAC.1
MERVPIDGKHPLCRAGAALRDTTHWPRRGRDRQMKWVIVGDRRMAHHPTASFVGGKTSAPIQDGVAEDIQRAVDDS